MCKKLHCSARFGEIKMRLLKADDCAEIANILFNIMNEKRAKRGYKCRKGIVALWESHEQYRRHGGVKRGGKKNGKRC